MSLNSDLFQENGSMTVNKWMLFILQAKLCFLFFFFPSFSPANQLIVVFMYYLNLGCCVNIKVMWTDNKMHHTPFLFSILCSP